MNWNLFIRSPWGWLGAGLLAVIFRGAFLDVMDVDASQYASISMEMAQNGSWLEVLHGGRDYLDKPPLLFWLSALSFNIFGLSNWAYKLPSILAAAAGVYAVYRFCRLFYTRQTALHAAFILGSSTGMLLLCNDVRTDTLLLGFTALSVWRLAEYQGSKTLLNLFWAFASIGLAMLAKGPIGLIMPAFALGGHLLLRRNFKGIFDPKYLVGLALTALVLLPMCWGLYHQFDLHPEKTVNGKTGVSGLYFFFWEQSFGRITGENVWKNDTGYFYFLHVYLWAFLPWCLLLVPAFIRRFKFLLSSGFRLVGTEEGYSTAGFVLTFIALSLSKYKLPHYIFITLPWAAVMTAAWLNDPETRRRLAGRLLYPAFAGIIGLSLAMRFYIFTEGSAATAFFTLAGTTALVFAAFRLDFSAEKIVQTGVFLAILAGFVLNFHFYPHLLPWQASASAGKFVRAAGIPPDRVGAFLKHGHALEFYKGALSVPLPSVEEIRAQAGDPRGLWIYTSAEGKTELDKAGISYIMSAGFNHFQAALLKASFLNPKTRENAVEKVYLLKIKQ